jgi:RNA polymerase sigma-70 factor (ECF subfamily)
VKFSNSCIIETENSYFQLLDKYQHIPDQQVLEKFYETRDNKWLGILLQRYTLLLLGVCMKYLKNEDLARDSVQQIFLKVITELHKYKVDYFKSWIYMVAKNYCLMQLRVKPGRITVEVNEKIAEKAEDTDKQEIVQNEKIHELMSVALNELNPEQQQCVTLFYLKKKSYSEISEATGFTLMQVKSHIQNGKRNLKILIERKLNER